MAGMMTTRLLFSLVVAAVGIELLLLVRISRANVAALLARGAILADHSGVGRANVLLRSGWLAAMLAEVWLLERPFVRWLAATALLAALVALALRLLSMRALGERWTLPTVVMPGGAPVRSGIYRCLRHPNWSGVAIEIAAIPLLHTAYLSATAFLLLECWLLSHRVRREEQALAGAECWKTAEMRSRHDEPQVVGIIGAGAAGLAMAKALKERGIRFEVLERQDAAGGLWADPSRSAVAKNTHAVSPKEVQAFSDWPMPESYADFPHHSDMAAYLRSYCAHHDLYPHIRFSSAVRRVQRQETGWAVELEDGSVRRYADLVLATGYHDAPQMPSFEGRFDGEIVHSKDYAGPGSLTGKRVLVIGAGQSAMDILADAAVAADHVLHSTRRGFICVPRYAFGKPLEVLQENPPPLVGRVFERLPLPYLFGVVATISRVFLWLNGLSYRKLRLPAYRLSDNPPPPTMDQKVLAYYAQGDIRHKGSVRRVDGRSVMFDDGTVEEIDTIVCATGFKVDYPIIDRGLLNWPEGAICPMLYRNVIHPHDDHLFALGLVHPIGSHWRVFEYQSALAAGYIEARRAQCHRAYKLDALAFDDARRQQQGLAHKVTGGLMVNKQGYIALLRADIARLARSVREPAHANAARFDRMLSTT